MSQTSQSNSTDLLKKPDQVKKESSRRRFLRPWFLFHKRLGTMIIALPIIWYALSGTIIAIARDFNLDQVYRFFQQWHSFQPVNRLTYQVINGLVALSILALFISGIVIWRLTKRKKRNKTPFMRKSHSLLSPLFGTMGVIFAISGWTNVLLSNHPSESLYQLSRAIHNGSWLHYSGLHCCYGVVGGLGLTVVAITGLLSPKRPKTPPNQGVEKKSKKI